MKSIVVPGYEQMFREKPPKYEEVLQDISSDRVIMIIISLNAELNSTEDFFENQKRLFAAITYRFSHEQSSLLNDSLTDFAKKIDFYNGEVFGRRYLLAMLLKELKRDKRTDNLEDDPILEYNILKAYFIVVDEVNKADNYLLENALKSQFTLMPTFPLLWAQSIPQYEFNESSNPAFEMFKVAGFLKYANDKHKIHLKKYLNLLGFKSISNYLHSVNQLANSTLNYNPNEFLRKLTFIVPSPNADYQHLKTQSINQIVEKQEIRFDDLRRNPLYETKSRGFMIIDADYYKRKMYRGALFELHKVISTIEKLSFVDYKNDVSKKYFEEILFKGILGQMTSGQNEIIHFDSEDDIGAPDLYYRKGNSIFLIEFKDYLFPDTLVSGNSFESFQKYVEERFMMAESGKPKGVSQLCNCISKLFDTGVSFDSELSKMIDKGESIQIYPIICHTDFMFSMPGLNEYLQIRMSQNLKERNCIQPSVQGLSVVNIDCFFDLALRDVGFPKLSEVIDKYFEIVNSFRQKYGKTQLIQDYLMSVSSFDEVYNIKFRNEMIDNDELTSKSRISQMTDILGITQEQIDEVL